MIRRIKRRLLGEWETKRVVTAHMGMVSPSTGASDSRSGKLHLQRHSRTKAERSYWQCDTTARRFPVTAALLHIAP